MTEQIKKTLRDSAAARWTALLLLSLAMFCSYIFVDILSPIKDLMLSQRGWDSTAFGTMQSSETFLNVFVFFLIFAGIILDKMGVRFTALLSGAVMLTGACIKYYAISESFMGSQLEVWFTQHLNHIPLFEQLGVSPFYDGMPASAKLAAIGFMLFGCGTEMAGIMVSRGIVKWFKGKEMALAMGSEMALARLGVATCMIFSPFFAKLGGNVDVSRSVAFGVVLICIAVMMFVAYFLMDKKLDSQTGEAEEQEEPFKISDLGQILTSMGFWLVSLLCVLYYSAIFPFQKYAVNMLQCNLTFTPVDKESFWASTEVTIIQYGIMLVVAITAFMFNFMKNKKVKYSILCLSVVFLIAYCYMGYMRQSAELLISCHLTFAFILPMFKGHAIGGVIVAYLTILVLGASFSLVPASLWPSVPKLVDPKIIGSAYALIFWIQNIGLWLFPLVIGKVLDNSNVGITDPTKYDYTNPLLMLAGLGVAALVIGLILKAVDKKKGLGLELPNITE